MADGSKNNQPRRDKGPDDRFEWKRAARTISFWIVLILAVIIITTYFGPKQDQPDTIDFDKYRTLLQNGAIESAEVIEREFIGTLRSEITDPTQLQKQVRVVLPYITESMVEEWQSLGLKLEFKEKATNWLGYILTSILPWVILIGFWIFLLRRMQGGGTRGIFSFGKSRAKLLIDNKPKVTFNDVAGSDEAKEELQEVVQFLKAPKKFQKLGGRIPRGALLVGPPGTGKTLLGRAIAGEAGVPFFSMSGADFVEMFVGVGASRVRDLFEQGKKHAPCIIFIDEIDAVGRQRGAGLGGGHDEREQTLNQLLVEMDGFESNEGVILIAATNRPDVLDPALLRPGRFDRQIVVDRPDVRGREGVLRVHTKNIPLAKDVDLKVLAKGTPGMSGADLANLANEAALLAARRDANKVYMRDFEDAKDKVMMGAERKSMLISDEEKKLTAYHEAGHVLVALFTPGSDPVHKVTIIPRGRALGVTHYLPIDEKHSWAKKYIEGKLIHLLGGRAAERLVFDDYTNGAASDIKQATSIARKMVCDWGMSDKIGPLSLGTKDQEIFIGREMTTARDYSEATALEIDREVKRIVLTGQNKAEKILQENIDKLHILAQALLDREILDGEEITMLVEGKKLPPANNKKKPARRSRKRPARRPSSTTKRHDKTEQSSSDRLEKVDKVLEQLENKDSGKDNPPEKTDKSEDTKSDKSAGNSRRVPIRRGGPAARPGSRPRTTRPNVGRGTRSSSRPAPPRKERSTRPPVKQRPDNKDDKKE